MNDPELKHLATPKFRLHLKHEHIRAGIEGHSSYCPWAQAVKDAWFKKTGRKPIAVEVTKLFIKFSDMGKRYIYEAPPVVAHIIAMIDLGVEPKPVVIVLQGGQVTADKRPPRRRDGSPQVVARSRKQQQRLKKLRRAKLKLTRSGAKTVASLVGGEEPSTLYATKHRIFGLAQKSLSTDELQALQLKVQEVLKNRKAA